jgi:dTDP-4-dehydrorhamnose reductase
VKILVTGSSGLLGSILVPVLRNSGHEVFGHSNSKSGWVNADLTIKADAKMLINQTQPDLIINLVALTNVDICEKDQMKAYQLNSEVVENIVDAMGDYGQNFLIHISTDQVYDSPGHSAEDHIQLKNTYAFSKYAGELAARKVPSTIFRTNFFGKSSIETRSSFSDWILDSLCKNIPITVFDDVIFNPLALDTLTAMLLLAIERRIDGVFNLGSRGAISKSDFAFTLAKVYGLSSANLSRGSIKDADLLAYRPRDMSMDCARFESAFDVKLPTIFDEISNLK